MKVNKTLMKVARGSGIRPSDVRDTWRYSYMECDYTPEKAVRQYHYDRFQDNNLIGYSILTGGLGGLVALGGAVLSSVSGEINNYEVGETGARLLVAGLGVVIMAIPWSIGVCAVSNIKRRVVDGLPNYRKYRKIALRNENKLTRIRNDSR